MGSRPADTPEQHVLIIILIDENALDLLLMDFYWEYFVWVLTSSARFTFVNVEDFCFCMVCVQSHEWNAPTTDRCCLWCALMLRGSRLNMGDSSNIYLKK